MDLDNVQDIYPLSPTQAGMVFHSIADPDSAVYVGQVCCHLSGAVDAIRLKAAWKALIQRHDVFRTAFVWDDLDEPLQVVREEVDAGWSLLDWTELAAEEQEKALDLWLIDDRSRGFALDQAPLMRLALISRSPDRHHLVWTSHHALVDGWSVRVVLDELTKLYSETSVKTSVGLAPAFAYNRFIAWLATQDTEAAKDFWRQRLSGFRYPIELKTRRPIQTATSAGTHREDILSIDPVLGEAVETLARDLRISLFTVMQAAWGLLLHRYSDADDIVFGVTVAGRPSVLPGIESAVGLFINTLPVRHVIDSTVTLKSWLKQLHRETTDNTAYESTPLSKVAACSEVPPGRPLFDSILVYTSLSVVGDAAPSENGLRIEAVDTFDQSNFGLALLIYPGDSLTLKLVSQISRYEGATCRQMLSDVERVLRGICRHIDGTLGEIVIPNPSDRHRLLDGAFAGQAANEHVDTVLDQFARQSERCKGRPAVALRGSSMTYAELDEASTLAAYRLIDRGVRPGEFVGISMSPGCALITAILAVLKAGAAYVPIDPEYPLERIRHMVEDARMLRLVSDAGQRALFETMGVEILVLDVASDRPDFGDLPIVSPNAPAYLIYTSGSSGLPKGVVITHANLSFSTGARLQYYPAQPDAFLLLSSYAFDSSVAGIFWALCAGGKLVMTERRGEQDIAALCDCIAGERITHTLCLPSLYRVILEHGSQAALGTLKMVIAAGEILTPELVLEHRRCLPDVALFNEYGPTEGTVWCSVFDTAEFDGAGSVPIGRAIPGAAVYLLDSRQRRVPLGVEGEIYVGGAGVAAGYLGRDEETAKAFVSDPFSSRSGALMYKTGDLGRYLSDGSIEFTGRADEQIKLRGHRVEPVEIESILQSHKAIGSAVVLVHTENQQDAVADAELSDDAVVLRLRSLGNDLAEVLLDEIESLSEDEVSAILNESLSLGQTRSSVTGD